MLRGEMCESDHAAALNFNHFHRMCLCARFMHNLHSITLDGSAIKFDGLACRICML